MVSVQHTSSTTSSRSPRERRGFHGLHVDYLEWKLDLLPGVNVELIEVDFGKIDLSQIYVKPGTVLDLDDVAFLESKIAL
jgi:hypothetical protein